MAIYSNKGSKKYTNKSVQYKLGLSFVCVFSVMLINLLFNIIPFINRFIYGFFGLFSYAIFLSIITIGILFLCKKKINVAKRDIVYFILWLFFFICILQLLTSAKFFTTYGQYLGDVYNYKYTAGGLLFGIFVYPLLYLTHLVASYIILAIALVVVTALIVERLFAYSQLKKLTNVKVSPKIEENLIDEDEQELEVEKPVKPSNVDHSIFITDEEDEVPSDVVKSTLKEQDRAKARRLLGLDKDAPIQDKIDEVEELPDNFIKAKQKGISKEEYIKQPYNPFNNTVSSKQSIHTINEGRPRPFVHDENDDIEEKQSEIITKKATDIDEKKIKAKEFLQATRGDFKPLSNDDFDIYDANFTAKDFDDKNKTYKKQSKSFDQAFEELRKQRNMSSSANANIQNDVESEDVDYKPYTNKMANYLYNADVNEDIVKPQQFRQVNINEINKRAQTPKPKKSRRYIKPPIDLLKEIKISANDNNDETEENGKMLEATLESFKIPAKISSIMRGPTFTRYELTIPLGVSVNNVQRYANDIAMSLRSKSKVRLEIPISGKNAFGIEVPNTVADIVPLRDIIESYNFQNSKSLLTYGLGKDITGECRVSTVQKAPHTLVAGSTGSGKSVCLNAMLISWLYKASPEDLRIILIDPKQVEFTMYNDMPHLLIPKAITTLEKTLNALDWLINEMERRFSVFKNLKVRDIEGYNESDEVVNHLNPKMPFIVIVVDELGDLMNRAKKEIEEKINRLAAKSRAAGIHLVLATQRPSVDVITGVIKGNLQHRIAFAVPGFNDSRTILNEGGAETLLGKGDMLFATQDTPVPSRIQGALVSAKEVSAVVEFVKEHNEADFDEEIENQMFNPNSNGGFEVDPSAQVFDPLLVEGLRNFIKSQNASATKLQTIFSIGFSRASRILNQMETAGFISAKDNKNNRTILITQQEFEEKFGEDL